MANLYETLAFQDIARKQREAQMDPMRHMMEGQQLAAGLESSQAHRGALQDRERSEQAGMAGTYGQIAGMTGQEVPEMGVSPRLQEMAELESMKAIIQRKAAAQAAEREHEAMVFGQRGKESIAGMQGIDKFNLSAYIQEQMNKRAAARNELEKGLFGPRGRGSPHDVRRTAGHAQLQAAIRKMQDLGDHPIKKYTLEYAQAVREVEILSQRMNTRTPMAPHLAGPEAPDMGIPGPWAPGMEPDVGGGGGGGGIPGIDDWAAEAEHRRRGY